MTTIIEPPAKPTTDIRSEHVNKIGRSEPTSRLADGECGDSTPDAVSRKERWTSIVILLVILSLIALTLALAGLQTPATPEPPHWTDWPMM